MTAEIYQLRDYQSKAAIERAHKELEREGREFLARTAREILAPFVETTGFTDTSLSEMIPYHSSGIDGLWKDTDPA